MDVKCDQIFIIWQNSTVTVECYLNPTVFTAFIHLIKPRLIR